jgi:uncharacterized delta-60 repeat protein
MSIIRERALRGATIATTSALALVAACGSFGGDGGTPATDADAGNPGVGTDARAEVVLEIPASIALVHDQTFVLDVKVTRKPPFAGGMTLTLKGLPAGIGSGSVDITPLDGAAKLNLVVARSVAQGALGDVIVEARSGASVVGQVPLIGSVRGAPGELDTTFGKNGFVDLPNDFNGLAMRPDGSFYVIENTGENTVRKYTKDGALDTTFATAGVYTPGPNTPMRAIAWKGTNLFLAGNVRTVPAQWHLRRLDGDGKLDTSYGTGGTYVRAMPASNDVRRVFVGPSGEAILAGAAGASGDTATIGFVSSVGATAYDTSNNLDAGLAQAQPPAAFTAAVYDGARTVAVGGPYVARMSTATHVADTTFGGTGRVKSAITVSLTSVAVDGMGNYVVGGTEDVAPYSLYVARVRPDGTFDATFGIEGTGSFRTEIATAAGGGALTVTGDTIVQVASIQEGPAFRCSITRYTKSGKLDPVFGHLGKAVPPLDECYPGDVATQADGRIIVSGRKLLRLWP